MRVVIVGHGMVSAHLAAELAREPMPADLTITVLGEEPYDPYNRVLLGEVVAGRAELAGLRLPTTGSNRVRVRAGVRCTRIDRAARQVYDDRGDTHEYDHLVLATGAEAIVPAGLAGPRTHVLRSLDDARELIAAGSNAQTAAVVGAGVLGIEVACALAGRGLRTTLVGRGGVLDRQLDSTGAAALTAALAAVDVAVAHGTRVESRDGGGLLIDGVEFETDLVVLACGARPRAELATDAGLTVERGIVVGADLTCAEDPRVHAVGDCAQPPDGASGLIAQGWEQSRLLAALLRARALADTTTERQRPPGPDHQPLIRVKADRLVAVAMGRSGPHAPAGARRLCLADCGAGRYVEAVVQDDALIGAICIGDAALAADLTVAFTRGTPLPADPAQLLLKPIAGLAAAPTEASLTKLPDRATVCRCNSVTKGDIVACWKEGARSVRDVAERTRATTGCGTCADTVADLLAWVDSSDAGPDVANETKVPTVRA